MISLRFFVFQKPRKTESSEGIVNVYVFFLLITSYYYFSVRVNTNIIDYNLALQNFLRTLFFAFNSMLPHIKTRNNSELEPFRVRSAHEKFCV